MKTKLILIIGIIGLTFSCRKENPIDTLNVGLVAYYPFNGNAKDESGNGNNGIVNGATLTTDRFGKPNGAYYFNGIDNYIIVQNPKGLNNANYTYSFWLKILQLPLLNNCNFIMEFGYPDKPGHAIAINNEYPWINPISGWSVNSANSAISGINFQTGTEQHLNVWYNFLFVRNDTSVCIYENDKLIKYLLTNGSNAYYTDPLNLYFGARAQLKPDFFFNGIIDDIRIYNRVLTKTERKEILNNNQKFWLN